jgi:hypothetical protein
VDRQQARGMSHAAHPLTTTRKLVTDSTPVAGRLPAASLGPVRNDETPCRGGGSSRCPAIGCAGAIPLPPPPRPPVFPLFMVLFLPCRRVGRDRLDPVRAAGTGSFPALPPRRLRRRRNCSRMPTGTLSLRWLRTPTTLRPSSNLHVSCDPFTRMASTVGRRSREASEALRPCGGSAGATYCASPAAWTTEQLPARL